MLKWSVSENFRHPLLTFIHLITNVSEFTKPICNYLIYFLNFIVWQERKWCLEQPKTKSIHWVFFFGKFINNQELITSRIEMNTNLCKIPLHLSILLASFTSFINNRHPWGRISPGKINILFYKLENVSISWNFFN